MLLRNLTIENYRSFDNYKLDGFSRVNLLVGDNNSGKTSVIEGLEMLHGSNPLQVIDRIAYRRGESVTEDASAPAGGRTLETCANFFRGRTLSTTSSFRLSGGWELHARIEEKAQRRGLFDDENDQRPWTLFIRLRREDVSGHRRVLISQDGGMRAEFASGGASAWGSTIPLFHEIPIGFQGTSRTSVSEVMRVWDLLIRRGTKSHLISALQILDQPNQEIDDVDFSPAVISNRSPYAGIFVRLKSGVVVPMGSLGEGFSRLFAVAATLAGSAQGLALIDEIDTGMHHSRLSEMWRMVIKTAIELDVQVVATTHSLDCIRALASVCDDDESLRDEVALFSLDRRMDEAVRYGGDELSSIVAHEIEVR